MILDNESVSDQLSPLSEVMEQNEDDSTDSLYTREYDESEDFEEFERLLREQEVLEEGDKTNPLSEHSPTQEQDIPKLCLDDSLASASMGNTETQDSPSVEVIQLKNEDDILTCEEVLIEPRQSPTASLPSSVSKLHEDDSSEVNDSLKSSQFESSKVSSVKAPSPIKRSRSLSSISSRSLKSKASMEKLFRDIEAVPACMHRDQVMGIIEKLTNCMSYLTELNKDFRHGHGWYHGGPRSYCSNEYLEYHSDDPDQRLRTCRRICGGTRCIGMCQEKYNHSRCSQPIYEFEKPLRSHRRQSDDELFRAQNRKRMLSLATDMSLVSPEPNQSLEDHILQCLNNASSLETLLTGNPPSKINLTKNRGLSKSMPNMSSKCFKGKDELSLLSTIESRSKASSTNTTNASGGDLNTLSKDDDKADKDEPDQDENMSSSLPLIDDETGRKATAKLKEVKRIEKELEDCVKLSMSLEDLIIDYVERKESPSMLYSYKSVSMPDVRFKSSMGDLRASPIRGRHSSNIFYDVPRWGSDELPRQRYTPKYGYTSSDSYYSPNTKIPSKRKAVMNLNLSSQSISITSSSISHSSMSNGENYRKKVHKLNIPRRYKTPENSKVVRFRRPTTPTESSESSRSPPEQPESAPPVPVETESETETKGDNESDPVRSVSSHEGSEEKVPTDFSTEESELEMIYVDHRPVVLSSYESLSNSGQSSEQSPHNKHCPTPTDKSTPDEPLVRQTSAPLTKTAPSNMSSGNHDPTRKEPTQQSPKKITTKSVKLSPITFPRHYIFDIERMDVSSQTEVSPEDSHRATYTSSSSQTDKSPSCPQLASLSHSSSQTGEYDLRPPSDQIGPHSADTGVSQTQLHSDTLSSQVPPPPGAVLSSEEYSITPSDPEVSRRSEYSRSSVANPYFKEVTTVTPSKPKHIGTVPGKKPKVAKKPPPPQQTESSDMSMLPEHPCSKPCLHHMPVECRPHTCKKHKTKRSGQRYTYFINRKKTNLKDRKAKGPPNRYTNTLSYYINKDSPSDESPYTNTSSQRPSDPDPTMPFYAFPDEGISSIFLVPNTPDGPKQFMEESEVWEKISYDEHDDVSLVSCYSSDFIVDNATKDEISPNLDDKKKLLSSLFENMGVSELRCLKLMKELNKYYS